MEATRETWSLARRSMIDIGAELSRGGRGGECGDISENFAHIVFSGFGGPGDELFGCVM